MKNQWSSNKMKQLVNCSLSHEPQGSYVIKVGPWYVLSKGHKLRFERFQSFANILSNYKVNWVIQTIFDSFPEE